MQCNLLSHSKHISNNNNNNNNNNDKNNNNNNEKNYHNFNKAKGEMEHA